MSVWMGLHEIALSCHWCLKNDFYTMVFFVVILLFLLDPYGLAHGEWIYGTS